MLIRDYLSRAAISYPDRAAYIEGDITRDWKTAHERISRLGAAFQRLGIGKGDRVGMLAREHIEMMEVWLACLMIGAVRVGVNWRYSRREKLHLIRDSDMKLIVVDASCIDEFAGGLDEAAAEGRILVGFGGAHGLHHDYERLIAGNPDHPRHVPLGPDDIVAFSYTTGTTGLPKGAIWTQGTVLSAILHANLNIGLRREDVWLSPIPTPGAPLLFNTYGLITGMSTVLIGGDFTPEKTWELVERHGVTSGGCIPTMLRRLIEAYEAGHYDISSLRSLFYGSSPMPPALLRHAFSTLGCELMQAYGSTETGGWVTCLRQADHVRALEQGALHLLTSCGRPCPHADVRILDPEGNPVERGEVGEICVRSEANTPGYHNLPQESADLYFGTWLRTGDLAREDEQGYHYIVDRRRFMIISGGYNVYPVVIENILSEHPAVREVGVVGAPHPEWGEAVSAVVSLKPGAAASMEELIAFVRPELGRWEVPKFIDIVEDLPKGVTGKIDKLALRRHLESHAVVRAWAADA